MYIINSLTAQSNLCGMFFQFFFFFSYIFIFYVLLYLFIFFCVFFFHHHFRLLTVLLHYTGNLYIYKWDNAKVEKQQSTNCADAMYTGGKKREL